MMSLVENLLHGKNSLLFAYGVTGSCKTYTMNGENQDRGIIPRGLGVIFNNIGHFQAKKHIFKPDRMNGFDIQSDLEAQNDRQAGQHTSKNFKTPDRRCGQENYGPRVSGNTKSSDLDEYQAYSVFITFVEVYKNIFFYLRDDMPIEPLRPGRIQSKILRQDQHKNMYVHAVTELEVKSADEATEILVRGQKRRRVAHTTLNAESSRIHSVFIIRVVQAPLDNQGFSPEKVLMMGQLSPVDLAGSERSSRTKTCGERLREAGSFNNTLMTLRSCIEILRENPMNGTSKMVPYRDSKITHLLKSFFDGEGKVRMIVCGNSRADDYDETLMVMRFAEMAQEVQITRAVRPNIQVEVTPRGTPVLIQGRRKANRVLTEAYRKLEKDGLPSGQSEIPFDIDIVFTSARTDWPPLDIHSASDDRLINNLVEYLQVRIREQQNGREQQMKKCVEVHTMIAEMEEELILKRREVASLKAEVLQERSLAQCFENRVLNADSANASLQRHLAEHQKYAKLLVEKVRKKELMLNQYEYKIEKVKAKEKSKRQLKLEKVKKELKRHRQVQAQLQQQKDRFLVMRDLLYAGCAVKIPGSQSSDSNCLPPRIPSVGAVTPRPQPRISDSKGQLAETQNFRGPAISTHKRRSQSAERWVYHRQPLHMEVDTSMPSRSKSITKLVNPNEYDLTDAKVTKYALTTKEQDSLGAIETKIYKGDVLSTKCRGAQVVLKECEMLRRLYHPLLLPSNGLVMVVPKMFSSALGRLKAVWSQASQSRGTKI